jgi:hypothetical protein
MRKRTLATACAAAVAAAALAGGAAVAGSGDEPGSGDVSPQQGDRATEAALRATHGGHANSVERDSENGATWEVEVTRPDGRTVDVRLDGDYRVVVIEGDHEDSDGD